MEIARLGFIVREAQIHLFQMAQALPSVSLVLSAIIVKKARLPSNVQLEPICHILELLI